MYSNRMERSRSFRGAGHQQQALKNGDDPFTVTENHPVMKKKGGSIEFGSASSKLLCGFCDRPSSKVMCFNPECRTTLEKPCRVRRSCPNPAHKHLNPMDHSRCPTCRVFPNTLREMGTKYYEVLYEGSDGPTFKRFDDPTRPAMEDVPAINQIVRNGGWIERSVEETVDTVDHSATQQTRPKSAVAMEFKNSVRERMQSSEGSDSSSGSSGFGIKVAPTQVEKKEDAKSVNVDKPSSSASAPKEEAKLVDVDKPASSVSAPEVTKVDEKPLGILRNCNKERLKERLKELEAKITRYLETPNAQQNVLPKTEELTVTKEEAKKAEKSEDISPSEKEIVIQQEVKNKGVSAAKDVSPKEIVAQEEVKKVAPPGAAKDVSQKQIGTEEENKNKVKPAAKDISSKKIVAHQEVKKDEPAAKDVSPNKVVVGKEAAPPGIFPRRSDCICFRKVDYVICGGCSMVKKGARISKPCPAHPGRTFSKDLKKCMNEDSVDCGKLAVNLKEKTLQR